ncbi:hypothetical protein RRG08_029291 [Elysia crispata]|uniref:Integrase catalytic domain-containing protein n=1 Tax=Elysia crispata TaxID=231223 RepID=A0AAE1A5E6_9GAST|nr:hypothetical protein RRG08_029291 [Elysia crispata]
MANDIQRYCDQCHRCQAAKKPGVGVHQPPGHLATAPLEVVAMDFTKLEVSADGKCFEAEVIRGLCNLYGITKSRTSPYNPGGNGVCERSNRSLHNLSRFLSAGQKQRWPDFTQELVFCYKCYTACKDWPVAVFSAIWQGASPAS